MTCTFIQGDCHVKLLKIPDKSVQLIYVNPPFNITEAVWDKKLDWKLLFPQMFRIIKDNGCIVIHCSIPFTYELIAFERPKYHYVWEKDRSTCYYLAKKQPLRKTEEILVYYKKQCKYFPQMVGDQVIKTGIAKDTQYYGERKNKKKNSEFHVGKYPTTILKYARELRGDSTRPLEMIRFVIQSYTEKGDTVLDFTCNNGITGKVCKELGRHYTGVDVRIHKDWFT